MRAIVPLLLFALPGLHTFLAYLCWLLKVWPWQCTHIALVFKHTHPYCVNTQHLLNFTISPSWIMKQIKLFWLPAKPNPVLQFYAVHTHTWSDSSTLLPCSSSFLDPSFVSSSASAFCFSSTPFSVQLPHMIFSPLSLWHCLLPHPRVYTAALPQEALLAGSYGRWT